MSEFVVGPSAPAELARRACYADMLTREQPLSEPAFLAVAEKHGFDGDWIDEQARRGFIARKAVQETGETAITVTSKTLHRYSL
jgi:hypothetical protein